MRTLKTLALVLPLTLCGCLLSTGQTTIDYDLGTINVTDSDNLAAVQVDLSTNADYEEHKDDLEGVTDLALLASGFATGSPRAAELIDRAFAGPPCFLSPLNGF